jgi:hypothetical protein
MAARCSNLVCMEANMRHEAANASGQLPHLVHLNVVLACPSPGRCLRPRLQAPCFARGHPACPLPLDASLPLTYASGMRGA